ncbi:MAG TPA: DoxX family protein [Terriglobales bacterium]|jgi:putative oxidoreductase
MTKFLGKYSDHVYAITRVVVGLLFACHGAQKLFGVLGGTRDYSDLEGLLAGVIEFFGGTLVALGLAAGLAAFIASGEMAVAYFKAHTPIGLWPIQNGGEWAVLYCFFFLYVAFHGAGRFSLDALLFTDKARSARAGS